MVSKLLPFSDVSMSRFCITFCSMNARKSIVTVIEDLGESDRGEQFDSL